MCVCVCVHANECVYFAVLDMLLAMLKRLFNSSAFSHPMALYHVLRFLRVPASHQHSQCVNMYLCLLFSNGIFTNAIHADRLT